MAASTTPSAPSLTNTDFEQLAERVDRAIAEARALPDDARAKAMAVKSAVEEFHKVGLTRIVQRLKDDPRGKELLFELVDDPAVHALFTMHGLVRADLRTRVARVLDMVRPYMQSHGGDVELVGVEQETVALRLTGSCNGCSMSAVTLRNTVEEALREHLPQIKTIEVVPDEPERTSFVPVETLSSPLKLEAGWAAGPRLAEIEEAVPYRWDPDAAPGLSILIVRFRNALQAFRNECAHIGMALDGGHIDPETGILTCPWHGFRFDCTNGECITAPQAQLEALPLRVEQGRVIVRIAG